MMRDGDHFFQKVFTKGTPQCAIACSFLGVLVALLLLWVGVWQTLLICAMVAVGAFIGGVKDKKNAIQHVIRSFEREERM